MPDEIQYDANATPPQFTNNADMVIEPGTHVRAKIIGLRTEVGEMWAIGSINGDFLGYEALLSAYEGKNWNADNSNIIVVCRHKHLDTRRWINLQLPLGCAIFSIDMYSATFSHPSAIFTTYFPVTG